MRRLFVTIFGAIIGVTALLYFTQDNWNPEPAFILECIKSHEEEYTYYVPVTTGFVNNVPIITQMPMEGIRTVCDEYQEIPNPEFIEK
jgi:hypothetical protein